MNTNIRTIIIGEIVVGTLLILLILLAYFGLTIISLAVTVISIIVTVAGTIVAIRLSKKENPILDAIEENTTEGLGIMKDVAVDVDTNRRVSEDTNKKLDKVLDYYIEKEQKNEEEKKTLLNAIEELKQQLASKDLPDWDQVVKEFLAKGKLQEAIESIDTNAADEEAAKKHLRKAQLLIVANNFPEAEAHYMQAADIFPSLDNNFTVAKFFQDLNRFKEAEDYYTRCLNQATSPEEKATVLNNLGTVQSALNDYAQAEVSYTEALQIRKELAAKNPQAYLPNVATTLVNLSIFYQDYTPNKAKSLQYVKKAIEVLEQCNETPWVWALFEDARRVIDYWKGKN